MVKLLISCLHIKHLNKVPLLFVFFEQFSDMAWAMSITSLVTKTNLQPSVWQPLHWTPSKNSPPSEYFDRSAPIYDKIGTRRALSLEACISIQRSKQEMLRQEFVCNFQFKCFTESINKRYFLDCICFRTLLFGWDCVKISKENGTAQLLRYRFPMFLPFLLL